MAVESFCRLCASKSENYVKIYEEEGKQLNLATKIIQCLHIWLKPDDILPKTVCMDCCLKLDHYFDFFELCTQSQKSLMEIFDEGKETVVNKYEKDIENHDDFFIKSISAVFNNGDANVIADRGEITHPVNDNNGESNITYDNDVCDENNYQDGDIEEEYNGCDGYEYKLKIGVNCNGDYSEDCAGNGEGDDNHLDENSQYNNVQSVLNENRGTSRRKLRIPVKRSSKNHNNDIGKANKNKKSRNNIAKKRPSRRCAIKNVAKKLKPVPKKLLNKNEAAVKTNDNNGKSKSLNINEADKIRDGNDQDHGKEDEEETSDKISRLNCNKKLMEGYTWKCTDCTAELKTLSALKDHHQVMHKQPPNFKCSHCTKVYTRYRSFARHIKLHGNPKKFSCEVCGKGFSQKTVLQSHRTVHTEERPHICPQCGKAFKQFSSLYLHSKCHLPEEIKPKFPCTVCPKQFSTKHTLETHMKIHTGERNYICDICGKSFIAKGSLDYHILAHNDSKPHNCTVCNKGFKTVRLLTKHSTLHTGIKPHQCDVCGKQFRERSALKEHNRIHTGAMPYSCEFCGKLFRFKGILTVHRRQHTGERPYSCQDCRREFTNWANYNKHMKRRHRNLENNQNAQSTTTNNLSSNRLAIRQDLQSHPPTSQESAHQALHQACAVEHGSQHIITVIPQHQEPEDEVPPPISVQQLTPISSIQLHMQQPVIYNDNTSTTSNSDNSNYKLVPNDHTNNINADVYRVSHYIPTHAITGMSYYIPPIHQPVLPTRNQ